MRPDEEEAGSMEPGAVISFELPLEDTVLPDKEEAEGEQESPTDCCQRPVGRLNVQRNET